ncbi:hypothetical protein JAAARDRAFT_55673 [Jaapia argillacea MUCL 33604]|uniref:NAD-dependent epimerase/dehydratase domain-containing protein n=1 Tax=Jaapia argillacea MUCL 33604 TaxID=933084 RepID=A0A067Q1M5_9AGAM|nr:hypothetical protein JAAARDRAFT_55673 [Jaapia argillacea MUCL 33604]
MIALLRMKRGWDSTRRVASRPFRPANLTMEPALQRILVVGGNGFIGSAVCKAALARGVQVTSISSSGRPYRTLKGHTPAWANKVDWQKADALRPETYAHILPNVTAVVHTLGTLLEDGAYKAAVRTGDVVGLVGSITRSFGVGGGKSPLGSAASSAGSYETMNRDSALRVCDAFLSATPQTESSDPKAFVYVSAEDTLRPWIPARYIETKREAEKEIESMVTIKPNFRAVYIRPSLVYHAHLRPLVSPLAALLDLSATVHRKMPSNLPTPSAILRTLAPVLASAQSPSSPSPLESMANAMTIPPIHVEHVAEAIAIAVDPSRIDIRGVYGVREMRELIGWSEKGQELPTSGHVNQHV